MMTRTITPIRKKAGLAGCLVCAAVIIIFSPGVVLAYLYPESGSDNQFSRNLEGASDGPYGRKTLFLYDRISVPEKDVTAFPSSNSFVPVDALPFNEPLHLTVSRAVSLENSLSRLLYANLKARKIYEGYAALQKRSRELLTRLSLPHMEAENYLSFEPQMSKETTSLYAAKQALETRRREIGLPSIGQEVIGGTGKKGSANPADSQAGHALTNSGGLNTPVFTFQAPRAKSASAFDTGREPGLDREAPYDTLERSELKLPPMFQAFMDMFDFVRKNLLVFILAGFVLCLLPSRRRY